MMGCHNAEESQTILLMFSWDDHVENDIDIGFSVHLEMNDDQLNEIQSPKCSKSVSFLTDISLPFEMNHQWLVKTKWNHKSKIFKMNAFEMAAQFEYIYMSFVQEAINRNYCYNEFDPITFMCDCLEPVPPIKLNTYVRWNDFWGRIVRSKHGINVYRWNISKVQVYQIQIIDMSKSIDAGSPYESDNYMNITADPSVLSILNEQQPSEIVRIMVKYQLQKQQTEISRLQALWQRNGAQLEEQISASIRTHLRNKNVNRLIPERKCNLRVKRVEFDEYLEPKCNANGLEWSREQNNSKLSLTVGQLQQIFGEKTGSKEHIVIVKKEKSVWIYFLDRIEMRYSYTRTRLFMSFKVKGKDPDGDVIATA
eukprot:48357_1